MASLDYKVSIEKVIHKALTDAIQTISDEHHIQVDSLSINWLDVSDHRAEKYLVRSIGMRTSSFNR